MIKYQEFEPAILGDIEKPKFKARPEKPEELWVVQLADKIDDMFATCLRLVYDVQFKKSARR